MFFFRSALQSLNISLLTTKSDWHLISPNNINPGSKMKAINIRGSDHRKKKLLIVNKFSLSGLYKEMYEEKYGGFAYRCLGEEG